MDDLEVIDVAEDDDSDSLANDSVYLVTYDDSSDDSLSSVVIEALAVVSGRDPISLEPLYTAIDPDALDSIFDSTAAGADRIGTVSFPFGEFRVTVTDGERVEIDSIGR